MKVLNFSKFEKYSENEELERATIASKNTSNSLKNANLFKVKRSFKIDLTKLKRKNGKFKKLNHNEFETFNNIPQNKDKKAESLPEAKEKQI